MRILRNESGQRPANTAYQNDGVLDLFVGWCVFLAGLTMLTGHVWMGGAYVVLAVPLYLSFKRSLSAQRLGDEKLRQANSGNKPAVCLRLAGGLALVTLMGLVLLYLLLGASAAGNLRQALLVVAGGVVALAVVGGFTLIGSLYNEPRWYAYGALAVILGLLAWSTGMALPWVIMAVGSFMAMTGSVYLLRFMRNNSLLPLGQRPLW
jgi:hypothetical protein